MASVLAVVLAVCCLGAAAGDFMALASIVAIMDRLGMPRRMIPVAGAVKTLGAVGVVIGLWVRPIGLAANSGLVVYFCIAVALHLRVRDSFAETSLALGMLALSTAALVAALV